MNNDNIKSLDEETQDTGWSLVFIGTENTKDNSIPAPKEEKHFIAPVRPSERYVSFL